MVATHRHDIATRGQGAAHDITDFEPGAVADLNRLFEEIAPGDEEYRHHLR